MLRCLLCNSQAVLLYEIHKKKYYKCQKCFSLMLDPLNYLSSEEEEARYRIHNNDIDDPSYQKFVAPIVKAVKDNYNINNLGLDYGAGPGPVATSLLEKEGYVLSLYDPYFHRYPQNLLKNYDYIICSEVIEHFHKPYEEFNRLNNILNKKGSIFCLTSLYDEYLDFRGWNYKNDETHVFFYHKRALEWIRDEFNFSDLEIEGNLIKLSK